MMMTRNVMSQERMVILGGTIFITSFKTIKSILALIEKKNNSVRKVLNSILIIFNLNTEQKMTRKMFAWIPSSRVDNRLEFFLSICVGVCSVSDPRRRLDWGYNVVC